MNSSHVLVVNEKFDFGLEREVQFLFSANNGKIPFLEFEAFLMQTLQFENSPLQVRPNNLSVKRFEELFRGYSYRIVNGYVLNPKYFFKG